MALLRHGRCVEARGTGRSNGANDRVGACDLLLQLVFHNIVLVHLLVVCPVVAVRLAAYGYDIKCLPLPEELDEVALKIVQVRLVPLLILPTGGGRPWT